MPTYRHKTIKRYRIGRFEFKNGILVTLDEADDKEFIAMLEKLKKSAPREVSQIVRVNRAAAQQAETSMSRVIRGPQTSGGVASTSKESGPRLTDEEVKKIMAERAEREEGLRKLQEVMTQPPEPDKDPNPAGEGPKENSTPPPPTPSEPESASQPEDAQKDAPSPPSLGKKSGGINLPSGKK